jgi:hypothetical protein
MGSVMVAQVLQALQNGCAASCRVALSDPGGEHLFKAIHDLPVPFRATLPNLALKYRLGQKNSRSQAGGLFSLPHLKDYYLGFINSQGPKCQ